MSDVVLNYINDLYKSFNQTKVTDIKGKELNLVDALTKSAEKIVKANSLGGKAIFIGNGGSAAVASHKALDYWFTGKIRGISFSDYVNLTCVSNDFGYQNIFVKQIEMFANKDDILFAISSSGNSENIILAVEAARNRGCQVFTFSGFEETNRLRKLGDLNFYTSCLHFNKVESIHLLLCDCILEIILEHKKKLPENQKDILISLDRDGTLIYDEEGYFGKSDDWREKIKFYKGAIKVIKTLNNFASVIVTTNQIGVARGFYGPERVKEINEYLDKLIKKDGAKIDGWYFSPYIEKSWAEKNNLNLNSQWISDSFPETRKPETGMLKLAAADFGKDLSFYKKIFIIGDSLNDLKMGLNAGGIGIFFENKKNDHLIEQVKSLESANPGRIFRVDNLFSAVKIVKENI